MNAGSVARRYAKALLLVGEKSGAGDTLGAELQSLAKAFRESRELRATVANPLFPAPKRRAILEQIAAALKLSANMRNFLLVLLEKGRLGVIPDIERAYQALHDEKVGQLRAKIISAKALPEAASTRIASALSQLTGKKVLLETTQDPELLGGVVAQVGNLRFDSSLRSRLDTIRKELLQQK